jgi:hypothetical protein
MTLVAALLLASTSIAYIIFYSPPPSFDYNGRCLGTVVKKEGTFVLVYTLRDVNIPGERYGAYIRAVAAPEILERVRENNLIYWVDAEVTFT